MPLFKTLASAQFDSRVFLNRCLAGLGGLEAPVPMLRECGQEILKEVSNDLNLKFKL